MSNGARTSIAIVNYCTRDLLEGCLADLADHPGPVMVFDNASDDGSAEMVREKFPSVTLRASERNLGYGAAANELLAVTTTPYLLLMNADARPLPGAVAAVEHQLDGHRSAAVVGPRLIGDDGELQRSCRRFPTLGSFLVDQSGLRVLFDRFGIGDRHRRFAHDRDRVVPWVLGAVIGLRVEAVQAAEGFDDGFFLYFEEIDLSRRLLQEGWQTRFTADAVFRHIGGASSSDSAVTTTKIFYRSGARYFGLHSPGSRRWYPAVTMLSLGLSWVAALARHRRNDWPTISAVVADRRQWTSPSLARHES